MTDNPYTVLGLEPTATQDEIRAAYLRQAKANHPDLHQQKPEIERNAYAQQFQRAQAAYDLLTDPNERAFFDRHGHARKPVGAQLNSIERTLIDILDQLIPRSLQGDPAKVDYIGAIRHELETKRDTALHQVRQLTAAAQKLEKVAGRFTRNDDQVNHFAAAAKNHLARAQSTLEQKTVEAEHMTKCLAELEGYAYLVEVETQPVTWSQNAGIVFTQ